MTTRRDRDDDQHARDTDRGVAIVAEESADGTYEIRVTNDAAPPPRQGRAFGTTSEDVAPVVLGTAPAPRGGTRAPWLAVAGASVAILVAVVVVAAMTRDGGGDAWEPPPMQEEPAPVGDFRTFHIPEPVRPTMGRRVLEYDAGAATGEGSAALIEALVPAGDESEAPSGEAAPGDEADMLAADEAGNGAFGEPRATVGPDSNGDSERTLDDLTRIQLREIPVEPPRIVNVPALRSGQELGDD